ncbi:hypothetical protein GCM10027068_19770 [Prescottella soli]
MSSGGVDRTLNHDPRGICALEHPLDWDLELLPRAGVRDPGCRDDLVRDVPRRCLFPDDGLDAILEFGVEHRPIRENDEQRHPVPTIRLLRPDDERLDDLGQDQDDPGAASASSATPRQGTDNSPGHTGTVRAPPMKADTASASPAIEKTGTDSPTWCANHIDDDAGSVDPVIPTARSALRSWSRRGTAPAFEQASTTRDWYRAR